MRWRCRPGYLADPEYRRASPATGCGGGIPMTNSPHGAMYRELAPHQHHRVTYAELFFDLVFVFAMTQISHTLLAHFTPLGVLQVTLLFLRCGGCGSTPPGSPTGSIPNRPRFGCCCLR